MIDEYIPFITQVGFPIAAFFLLYLDLRKIVNKNTESTNALIELVRSKI